MDEVHERSEEVDLLLLIIRLLMNRPSSKVKIILMSATFEVTDFRNYFENASKQTIQPQIVSVEHRFYEIQEHYLDDVNEYLTDHQSIPPIFLDKENPHVIEEVMEIAIKLIMSFDQLEFRDYRIGDCGAVLVFLPGLSDITVSTHS